MFYYRNNKIQMSSSPPPLLILIKLVFRADVKQAVVFNESAGVINRLVTDDEEDELEDIAVVWNSQRQ